jgi:heme-degrading monooxygenase HmoA
MSSFSQNKSSPIAMATSAVATPLATSADNSGWESTPLIPEAVHPEQKAKDAEKKWLEAMATKGYTLAWTGRHFHNPHPKMVTAILNGLRKAEWTPHVTKIPGPESGKHKIRILAAKRCTADEEEAFDDEETRLVIPTGRDRFVVLTRWEIRKQVKGGFMSKEDVAKLKANRAKDRRVQPKPPKGERLPGVHKMVLTTDEKKGGFAFAKMGKESVFVHVSQWNGPPMKKGVVFTGFVRKTDKGYQAEECMPKPKPTKPTKPVADEDGFVEVVFKGTGKGAASPAKAETQTKGTNNGFAELDVVESESESEAEPEPEPKPEPEPEPEPTPVKGKGKGKGKGKSGSKKWMPFPLDE